MSLSPGVASAIRFVDKLNDVILFPLVALMFGLALLLFFWGLFQFLANADNEQARDTGRKHIMYGLIGMLVMISAFAILEIVVATFGVGNELNCAAKPNAPGCNEGPFKF